MTVVGFDFGTTNSLVSVVVGDRVIRFEDEGQPIPSVVSYEGGQTIVGREARKRLGVAGLGVHGSVVRSPKTMLGRESVDVEGVARNALNLTLPYRTYANVACFGAVVGSFCLAGCGIDCGPWRPGYRAMPPMPERCRAGTRRGWA